MVCYLFTFSLLMAFCMQSLNLCESIFESLQICHWKTCRNAGLLFSSCNFPVKTLSSDSTNSTYFWLWCCTLCVHFTKQTDTPNKPCFSTMYQKAI